MPDNRQQGSAMLARAGQEMSQLFGGFFDSIEQLRHSKPTATDINQTIAGISNNLWSPRIERHEDEHSIIFHAYLPQVPGSRIRVDIATPGRLKIFGESTSQTAYVSGSDRVTVKQLGQIEKDIPLPPDALDDQISAVDEGHSVVITVPKSRKNK
ncbi:hypothetical protein GGI07_001442 [Coemansia sp. Benny D115]|nr:hypothetical protein GGI07_001442 [Coemansia sp. Benny D115]